MTKEERIEALKKMAIKYRELGHDRAAMRCEAQIVAIQEDKV